MGETTLPQSQIESNMLIKDRFVGHDNLRKAIDAFLELPYLIYPATYFNDPNIRFEMTQGMILYLGEKVPYTVTDEKKNTYHFDISKRRGIALALTQSRQLQVLSGIGIVWGYYKDENPYAIPHMLKAVETESISQRGVRPVTFLNMNSFSNPVLKSERVQTVKSSWLSVDVALSGLIESNYLKHVYMPPKYYDNIVISRPTDVRPNVEDIRHILSR